MEGDSQAVAQAETGYDRPPSRAKAKGPFHNGRLLFWNLWQKVERAQRLALMERLKVMPFGEAWEECCRRAGVPGEAQWIKEAESYEEKVLAKRG